MSERCRRTARLDLRPFESADLDALAPIYGDSEVMAIRKIGVQTREQTATQLEEIVGHWQRHGFGLWAVIERDSGRLIGECGLRYADPEESAVELSYGLARDRWGRGYASEASRAALDFGFREIGLDRIIAIARAENERSHKVMRRLGMRLCRTWKREDGRGRVEYAIDRDRWLAAQKSISREEPTA
jgi:ribosomal-protein-alanine N-acetyltransferase